MDSKGGDSKKQELKKDAHGHHGEGHCKEHSKEHKGDHKHHSDSSHSSSDGEGKVSVKQMALIILSLLSTSLHRFLLWNYDELYQPLRFLWIFPDAMHDDSVQQQSLI